MEFAEQFGATVELTTTGADVGYFLVRRYPSVDHERFQATVAAAVGGREYIRLDSPDGFVVVLARYEAAQALRARPVVEHVGGVRIDPERFPTPEIVVDDQSGGER